MGYPPSKREGAEVQSGASGPMPHGAVEHLCELIASGLAKKPNLKFPRVGEIDAIEDPIVASAFALAEEELAELEAKFAQREAELQRNPPVPQPPDLRAKRLAELAENVREVIRDAERVGIRFFAVTDTEPE